MEGLKLACLYAYGCNMTRAMGVDPLLADFIQNGTDANEIRDILKHLIPFAELCVLAQRMGLEPFDEEVVRRYWLGSGDAKTTHNFAVLDKVSRQNLPIEALNLLFGCSVSAGRIVSSNCETIEIVGPVLYREESCLIFGPQKRKVQRGFVKICLPDTFVSVHLGVAREIISPEQAQILNKATQDALL